jgi:hypothetical protein
MSNLDVAKLAQAMVKAASGSLAKNWSNVKDYTEPELQRLASALVRIAESAASGEVTSDQAESMVGMERRAAESVLLAGEILSKLAAEEAINAAIGAVTAPINRAVGWPLL